MEDLGRALKPGRNIFELFSGLQILLHFLSIPAGTLFISLDYISSQRASKLPMVLLSGEANKLERSLSWRSPS